MAAAVAAHSSKQIWVWRLCVSLSVVAPFCVALSRAQTPAADFASLSNQARAALAANHLDRAAGLYTQALTLKPAWAQGWWSLGTIRYDQSSYAEAEHAFRHVVALAPHDGTAWVMLGLCEFELGDDAAALENLRKGDRLGVAGDPQLRHVVLYHEGELLRRTGRFEQAASPLDSLCRAGVTSDAVVTSLGAIELRIGSKELPAPETPGANIISRVGQAACAAARSDFAEAREAYSDVVKAYPSYPNIHYAYGRFLLAANDPTAAVKQFDDEIRNNPHEVFARLEIAAVKYRVDSAAGLPYAEQAVKLAPQLPFAHYLLGLLLVDTHQYARAIPELEAAQKGFELDPSVYFALGTAYSRTGKKAQAKRAWAEFARLKHEAARPSPLYYGQSVSAAPKQAAAPAANAASR